MKWLILLFACGVAHAGQLTVVLTAGEPPVTNGIFYLHGGKQGQTKTLLAAEPAAQIVKFVRTSTSVDIHCYQGYYSIDTNGNKILDSGELISPPSNEGCGKFSEPSTDPIPPPIVLKAPTVKLTSP
jgi:hypothetical protein